MSTIIICDMCGGKIDHQPITIALPGDEDWTVLDLCGKTCLLDVFGEPEDDEEGPRLRLRRKEDEPVEKEPEDSLSFTPELTMDDRSDNEKRFKAEAERMSGEMLGVRNRSKGER